MPTATVDLSGRNALIIGATEGIGRATALAFAEAGANVFAAGLGAERGDTLIEEIRTGSDVDAEFMEVDVTREAEVKGLVEAAAKRFGRIHAAVNNAGTEGGFGPVQDVMLAHLRLLDTLPPQEALAFAGALFNAMAQAVMDFIARNPAAADAYRDSGFRAFWAALNAGRD